MGGSLTARKVFASAAAGDPRAVEVVAAEARLVARAIAAVVTVVDPPLVVLGGGIGQAPGFVDAVDRELRATAPVQLELKVSALGADAVVDGCLAAGVARAWELVRAGLLPRDAVRTGSAPDVR
jgi:predicted NBD/HSP70 family sugar kinase